MSKIIWFDSLNSTNSFAKEHLEEYDNMSIIATLQQRAGRGQGDHTWYASAGKNLTFTIIFKPTDLLASDALMITRITTLALLNYLKSKGIKARIKWPNDIWVEDKKICGILIENILDGRIIKNSIIGVGLNINEKNWPKELPNPISLSELTNTEYDIRKELDLLHDEFKAQAALLLDDKGRSNLCERFEKNVFKLAEGI
ncbi:MAG TPA: biotin--[acetyl-CoA-carboxylase] ligase [Rikenellaceae bacterium]|nr:biotin--[acetyl-CoA-carboxylase] ligase [Rikenellaceae bacterium]